MSEKDVSKAEAEEIRIGVYVCHCGLNIAGSVDCAEVAEFASTLPHVVLAKDLRYTCSDQGQEIIKQDIKEHRLNRVVVASCSPRLHEPTFRKVCEEAGLNKYLFEMANIREHCSWVHLYNRKAATEKAKDLVKMAVMRAALLQPAVESEVPIRPEALVIGGGVAGIQAALDLADTGYHVYLVEKEPSIGGRMAQIDKTFPTMDCSICILAPKMSDVGHHPNITLLTYSEILDVKGYIGNFKVKVLKKPRYVTSDCTACGECAKVCPMIAPNEFDVGLAIRHAIYTPFAQAVPSTYVIDRELCLNKEGVIVCDKCTKACERQAINFEMKPEEIELEVGTIIVAIGADVFDPSIIPQYGYGRYPNVITSLEFERLINAGGPSGGKLLRPSDMQIPKTVAFVQCVGSRSEKTGKPYCSNVCCVGMVILSVGLEPRKETDLIQRLLTLSRSKDGFFMEAHPKLRPVDAATGGIFFAGCAESPKDIKDSVTQASAAAARAGILMAKGKVTVEALTPIWIPEKCQACGLCVKVCPYNAIKLDKERKKIEIIEAACAGCGTCGAECPFGALVMRHFTDEQIIAQIDAATEVDADKKIIAFCCNWCSYAGADFAGVSRIQYPENVRIIRTMCSGRVAPKFVERAFARGAAAVLVSGCHLGDCHYINANYQTKKRVERLWKKMEKAGLNKERLQLVWVSAAEGEKFAAKIREMQPIVESVTPEEIEKAKEVFQKALEL